MNKKQTVFLSAILGIGSIMMLSFLIISATKAKPNCVVSDDLTITGNTILGSGLSVAGSVAITNNLTAYGDTTLGNGSSDKVKAYKYCDEDGANCHDASEGLGIHCVNQDNGSAIIDASGIGKGDSSGNCPAEYPMITGCFAKAGCAGGQFLMVHNVYEHNGQCQVYYNATAEAAGCHIRAIARCCKVE